MEYRQGGMDPTIAEALKAERAAVRDLAHEFFPNALTRESLAPNFNLAPEDISDEELMEVHEFAVNAGAEMARAAQKSRSDVTFIANHDIFHAADMMQRTDGESPLSEFVSKPRPDRSVDTDIMREELYPLLFLAINEKSPISVEITSEGGRRRVKEYLKNTFGIESFPSLDADIDDSDADALQKLYEEIVKELLIANGKRALRKTGKEALIETLVRDVDACFQARDWPARYTIFAGHVFRKEYQENPRLFLDRFLLDIRSLPNSS